jgi:hypothetical protein
MIEPVVRVFTVTDKVTGAVAIYMDSTRIGTITPNDIMRYSNDQLNDLVHGMVVEAKRQREPVLDYQI